ncbi:MAG: mobile mystery protein B [Bacteroidota bacterium]|jgi:Fic-DOC domain mobile mystery protein B
MGLNLEYSTGQTPIDANESDGLKIKTITTQSELNEFEQLNIERALHWTLRKRFTADQILSEEFILSLHKKMYGDVWKWAGKFRASEKNLGIPFPLIGIELRKLIDDTHFWINHNSFPSDEIAIRFKHRLVSIHCFPNGNGRHSRLMADLIVEKLFQAPSFSWGQSHYLHTSNEYVRTAYLTALKEADQNNYKPLIEFART